MLHLRPRPSTIRGALALLFAALSSPAAALDLSQLTLQDIGAICSGVQTELREGDGYACGTTVIERNGEDVNLDTCEGTLSTRRDGVLLSNIDRVEYGDYTACITGLMRLLADAVSQAPPVPSPSCVTEGTLPSVPYEAANVLNSHGTFYAERERYAEALACFEAAVRYNPDYLTPIENLARLHAVWKEGDRDIALRYADQAIALLKSWMRDFERGGRAGDCSSNLMQEAGSFPPTAWSIKADVLVEDGDLRGAADAYSDFIEAFPAEGCRYEAYVGAVTRWRGEVLCKLGDETAAIRSYQQSLSLDDSARRTARGFQTFLLEAGYNPGPVDGVFGDASSEALAAWISDGCPHPG